MTYLLGLTSIAAQTQNAEEKKEAEQLVQATTQQFNKYLIEAPSAVNVLLLLLISTTLPICCIKLRFVAQIPNVEESEGEEYF